MENQQPHYDGKALNKFYGHIDDYEDYPMEYLLHLEDKEKEKEKALPKEDFFEEEEEEISSTTERSTTTLSYPQRSSQVEANVVPLRKINAGFADSWHSDPQHPSNRRIPFHYSTTTAMKQPRNIPNGYHPFSGFYHKNKFNQ